MTDEQMKALDAFDQASKKLANGKAGQGAENNYAKAYAALVTLGLRPQLRRKYR